MTQNQTSSSTPPVLGQTTLATLRAMVRQGQKLAMLTCYDATTARWLARGGIKILLVGDSAAQMILGYEQTIQAPLEIMIALTAAVKRGAPDCFVLGDMPFMSYQADESKAIENAGQFLVQGKANCVKLEVNAQYESLMRKLTRAGIPTCAHIGWRPQRTGQTGVPVVAGRNAKSIKQLADLALLMQDCGASMLLIEQSTAEAAQAVVDKVDIPVIGCGAGPACHGQVIILQDWLGMTDWQPSFATPHVQGGPWLAKQASDWVHAVQQGQTLKNGHPYKMHTPTPETPEAPEAPETPNSQDKHDTPRNP